MSEELKPIRMDGKYQTRDGRAVRILCVDRKSEDYPVIVLVTDRDGSEKYYSVTKYGLWCGDSQHEGRDLIEVDEQVRYVNVFPFHMGHTYFTQEDANTASNIDRTGTLKITHINGKLTSVEIVEDAALAKARGEA